MSQGPAYEPQAPEGPTYEHPGAFAAAVERLDDPLNDPLPGPHPSPWFRSGSASGPASEQLPAPAQAPEPARAPAPEPAQPSAPGADAGAAPRTPGRGRRRKPPQQPELPSGPGLPHTPASPGTPAPPPPNSRTPQATSPDTPRPTGRRRAPQSAAPRRPAPRPARDDETVGLRVPPPGAGEDAVPGPAGEAPGATGAGSARPGAGIVRHDETLALRAADETMALRSSDVRRRVTAVSDAVGGRAARRRAARRAGAVGEGTAGEGAAPEAKDGAAPQSRLEARRAARARKPSASAVASRAIGEVFITVGVLMLLFVTYQLWWTNVRAAAQANGARDNLQEDWAKGKRQPGAFAPGQGFAIMHIPKLDVEVPIAEGISKKRVLDRGMVGHYGGGDTIQTAMPDAEKGNFAVAGHRNTHGEPFRYINRLKPGDPIVVETQHTYYVYTMASILPQTPPTNTSVIAPVPNGSGFTKPGRYITLTTCTPEFTSTYRMIVWGKMVEERPRGKGKPDALIG